MVCPCASTMVVASYLPDIASEVPTSKNLPSLTAKASTVSKLLLTV